MALAIARDIDVPDNSDGGEEEALPFTNLFNDIVERLQYNPHGALRFLFGLRIPLGPARERSLGYK